MSAARLRGPARRARRSRPNRQACPACHACDTRAADTFISLSFAFHRHPDSQHSHFWTILFCTGR
ncbi:hypothetical protein BCEP27_100019 [Burkholderia cepacia]